MTAAAKENRTHAQWEDLKEKHALVAFEDLDSDHENNTHGVGFSEGKEYAVELAASKAAGRTTAIGGRILNDNMHVADFESRD